MIAGELLFIGAWAAPVILGVIGLFGLMCFANWIMKS